jgi:hypothetical protein
MVNTTAWKFPFQVGRLVKKNYVNGAQRRLSYAYDRIAIPKRKKRNAVKRYKITPLTG